MAKKAILIHGWEGYPEEGWRPWLQTELENKDFSVTNLAMPDTATPTAEKWLDFLNKFAKNSDRDTYFVGHSLGCITILRYLEALTPDFQVGGAVLVAAFSRDLQYDGYKGQLSSFFEKPPDWERIRKVCGKFAVIHSDDDQWVPVEMGREVAQNTGGEFVLVHGMKHFSGDDGITEAPVILENILKISGT